jgi:hypothetical protein
MSDVDEYGRALADRGRALIDNALDESAEGLHNEIAAGLGIPVAKRTSTRYTVTWFVSGGREQRQCRERNSGFSIP